VSFVLVFRTNIAYLRWWEGRVAFDVVCQRATNFARQVLPWPHALVQLHITHSPFLTSGGR